MYTIDDFPIGSKAYNHKNQLREIIAYEYSTKGELMLRFAGKSKSFMRNCKPQNQNKKQSKTELFNFC